MMYGARWKNQEGRSGNERRWIGSQKTDQKGCAYQGKELIPFSSKKLQTNTGFSTVEWHVLIHTAQK